MSSAFVQGIKHAARRTTGLVGVLKHSDPRSALVTIYKDTTKVLEKMPADAAYRKNTMALTTQRLAIVEQTEDVDAIEAQIGAGQAEVLILAAQKELSLAEKMLEWKAWEPLEEQPSQDQWKWP
eukprot:m.32302 g.32302  ORF g.32302 m.32302 type:complete len:124 (-) comp16622_c0_seq1:173-544(-)